MKFNFFRAPVNEDYDPAKRLPGFETKDQASKRRRLLVKTLHRLGSLFVTRSMASNSFAGYRGPPGSSAARAHVRMIDSGAIADRPILGKLGVHLIDVNAFIEFMVDGR